MSTHRTLDGAWAECPAPESCALLFHVELSVAEAEALPLTALLPLFEVVQPSVGGVQGYVKNWGDAAHELHRDYDLPARVYASGKLAWFRHGRMHRGHDRPAVIEPDGSRQWLQMGTLSRANDLPAIEYADGGKEWWVKGMMHRPSGGPTIVLASGEQRWTESANPAKLHRVGGPAVIHPDGSMEWWENGRVHRVGEPAVIRSDGSMEWWENGRQCDEYTPYPGGRLG